MKFIFIIVLIFSIAMGTDCIDLATKRATGSSVSTLDSSREEDINYMFMTLGCCCGDDILDQFSDDTEDITHKRVNPATDKLLEALEQQYKASDLKIHELVNLKYINSLYSFYDKEDNSETTLVLGEADGCGIEYTFPSKSGEDKAKQYRKGILLELLEVLHYWNKTEQVLSTKNMKGLL